MIPRNCKDDFKQRLILSHSHSTDDLESMVIQMDSKGITTLKIAEWSERMYGTHYTPQTISYMTRVVQN